MQIVTQRLRVIGILLTTVPGAWGAPSPTPPEYHVGSLAWTSGGDLIVALREVRARRPLQQKLVLVPGGNLGGTSREIPLSASSRARPVLAVWGDTERILIVTQLQDSQGDNPDIQGFDLKKKRWSDVAYVSCPKVFALRLGAEAFEFECAPFPGQKLASPGEHAKRRVKHNLELSPAPPLDAPADLGVFRTQAHSPTGATATVELGSAQPGQPSQKEALVVNLPGSPAPQHLDVGRLWEGHAP